MQERQLQIAIAASFTPDLVKPALSHWLEAFGLSHRVDFAQYNTLLQELINPAGLFGGNKGGVNVALARIGDWGRQGDHRRAHHDDEAIRRNVGDFIDFATAYARREGAPPLLVCICPEPRADLAAPGRAAFFADLEQRITTELGSLPIVQVVPSAELLSTYPVAAYDDPEGDELGHIPYTQVFFAALGTVVARRVRAFASAPYKVLALDCDNTLWTGVVGEDGVSGIVIDDARRAIQEIAVAQHAAGMLVCITSKNAEADVEEVFQKREMPLQRSQVIAAKINWRSKSENLRALAAELNLGLDAFVFVDDSRVECAEVRAACPEVLTIEIPADAREAAVMLRNVWAFDRWKITDEDRQRTELYRQNVERERSRRDAPSMSEFLESLGLQITIERPSAAQMPRVSQLTFRTNQLNFTTIRRSEPELAELLGGGALEALVTTVRDRFGDYGLVGEVFFAIDGDALRVDTFLLSCRVLQRGVEQRMIARLGEIAVERGLAWVDLACDFTAKNQPAQELVRSVGGDRVEAREGGLRLRLAAKDAAALVYAPGGVAEPVVDDDKPKKNGAAPLGALGPARSTLLESIAREMTSALAIHERVSPKKPQKERSISPSAIAAPRDATERAITEVAEEVLGVAPIGVNDDLFLDFGADSFAAVRIAGGVRRKLGREVLVATVLEAKTVAELAKALRGGARSSANGAAKRGSRSIHTLRREGSKRPLFLARPAGRTAGTLSYVALARHVDRDRPVHVFQNRPQIDRARPYASVDVMAEEYIAAMREIQPEGPYLLGGWCLGGKIAFEMANRLVERGQKVGLTLLFDTAGPGTFKDELRLKARRELSKLALRIYSHAPALSEVLPWGQRIARDRSLVTRFGLLAYWDHENDDPALVDYTFPGRFEREALAHMPVDEMWNHVYSVIKSEVPGEIEDVEGDGVTVRNGWRYFASDHLLDAEYKTRRVYPGQLDMFVTRGSRLPATWEKLTRRPIVVQEFDIRGTKKVPNVHNAMLLEENVVRFAEALNQLLDASDGSAESVAKRTMTTASL